MRRLLSAIASALRSTVSMIWEKCQKTGAWTMKAVASIGGGGGSASAAASPLQELEAAMAAEAARPGNVNDLVKQADDISVPPAHGGDGYDRIQRCCRDINMQQQPKREDWMALSDVQREWLRELTPSMRLVVGNIERDALVQHMKGGRGLKGVIRCDAESVAAWQHANAIEAAIAAEADGNEPELTAPATRIAV